MFKFGVKVLLSFRITVHGSQQVDHRGPHFLWGGVQVHGGLHAGRRLLGLDNGYESYDTEALVPFLKVCWKFVAAKEHAYI